MSSQLLRESMNAVSSLFEQPAGPFLVWFEGSGGEQNFTQMYSTMDQAQADEWASDGRVISVNDLTSQEGQLLNYYSKMGFVNDGITSVDQANAEDYIIMLKIMGVELTPEMDEDYFDSDEYQESEEREQHMAAMEKAFPHMVLSAETDD